MTDYGRNPRRSGTFHATYSDVSRFAGSWPAYGTIRPVAATFDRNGDLVDLTDTDGMDEQGVGALVDYLQSGAIGHVTGQDVAPARCCDETYD